MMVHPDNLKCDYDPVEDAHRELDFHVANIVMDLEWRPWSAFVRGKGWYRRGTDFERGPDGRTTGDPDGFERELPFYSGYQIEDTWKVIDRMIELGYHFKLECDQKDWTARFSCPKTFTDVSETGDSEGEAVCKAALAFMHLMSSEEQQNVQV